MKILIIQNRKGIGDLIIFLPFIEALAKIPNKGISSREGKFKSIRFIS